MRRGRSTEGARSWGEDGRAWHFGCYGKAFVPSCFDELAAKLRRSDIAKRRAADEATFAERKPTCQGTLQTALTSRLERKPQKRHKKTASGGP